MNLILLSHASLSGAVCLDGSPPGFYWSPASTNASANKWVIFFQGGGWCYSAEECLQRASTSLGSSKSWTPTTPTPSDGVLASDPSKNPLFGSWNKAYLQYCDGASFSGNAKQEINGTTLYYRGHAILHATMKQLFTMGIGSATDVLITGCSAGGLSTFLHADEIAEMFPSSTTVKALPGSGYFMNVDNLDDQPVYIKQMQNVFYLQNCLEGVNRQCVLNSVVNPHNCIFAPHTYPYIKTPTLILNSFDDSWQMGNVLGIDVPSFNQCAADGPDQCDQTEINSVNAFSRELVVSVTKAPKFSAPGNSVFLYSCWAHCSDVYGPGWSQFQINGELMSQAVSNWYLGVPNTNPLNIDCYLTSPSNCNPTC